MVQTRQNVRSTKPKAPKVPVCVPVSENNDNNPVLAENSLVNELHIRLQPISKLYTDDTGSTGRLPYALEAAINIL